MIPKKKNEMLLFKYQPINEYLIENLTKKQLFFRDPREYNDVFDSTMNVYAKGPIEKWIECGIRINKTMNELKGDPLKTREEVEEDVDVMIINEELKKVENSDDYKKDKLDDSYRPLTCCFCKNADNMLMWSHYANSHKGVCLVFKAKYKTIPMDNCKGYSLTINSEPRSINKVKYKTNLLGPINQIDDMLGNRVKTFEFFTTKSKCWKYEKEYRIFLDDPESKNIAQFEEDELIGIIFGLKVNYCSACTVINTVKQTFSDISIKFYKTQEDKTKYVVHLIDITNKIDNYVYHY